MHTPKTPKKKHAGQVSLTTWLPADLAQELDSFLASQIAGRVAVRPSRQQFTLLALREALDRAKAQPRSA